MELGTDVYAIREGNKQDAHDRVERKQFFLFYRQRKTTFPIVCERKTSLPIILCGEETIFPSFGQRKTMLLLF
jgi:hypothetical protein